MKGEEEYGRARTQAAERSSCGRRSSGVLEFGFQLAPSYEHTKLTMCVLRSDVRKILLALDIP